MNSALRCRFRTGRGPPIAEQCRPTGRVVRVKCLHDAACLGLFPGTCGGAPNSRQISTSLYTCKPDTIWASHSGSRPLQAIRHLVRMHLVGAQCLGACSAPSFARFRWPAAKQCFRTCFDSNRVVQKSLRIARILRFLACRSNHPGARFGRHRRQLPRPGKSANA
jgi:hypothetical protein